MKRHIAAMILASGLIAFSGLVLANEEVKGTLEKIDGAYYVVKDDSGKEHRLHFDNTTKKKGNIKPGAMVEVYVTKDGHVTEIEAGGKGK